MALESLFGRRSGAGQARRIYDVAVGRARAEAFYRRFGVPDTVDGRFELVVLHVFLVLRRLKGRGAAPDAAAQELCDVMFDDLDVNLREMGAGDMGVARRVRHMAEAFHGRVAAYDAALAGTGEALPEALARNLYGTAPAPPGAVPALAAYVRRQAGHLDGLAADAVCAGDFAFAELPR